MKQLRAAVLLVVLCINGLMALPLPRSIKRSSFDEAVAREELAAHRALLERFGWVYTHGEWADVLFRSGQAWVGVYEVVAKPFAPAFRTFGLTQSWGLFTFPDTHPHQLVVEVQVDDAWQTLYAGLDPEFPWNREVFAYRRIRGVYDGQTSKPGASWANLTRWTALEAMADPDVQAVRVSFNRFHTRVPGVPNDTSVVRRRHARIWTREDLSQ